MHDDDDTFIGFGEQLDIFLQVRAVQRAALERLGALLEDPDARKVLAAIELVLRYFPPLGVAAEEE